MLVAVFVGVSVGVCVLNGANGGAVLVAVAVFGTLVFVGVGCVGVIVFVGVFVCVGGTLVFDGWMMTACVAVIVAVLDGSSVIVPVEVGVSGSEVSVSVIIGVSLTVIVFVAVTGLA